MRILYYSPHPTLSLNSMSGYGTHMREMIQAFQELGHEVLPVIMGGTEQEKPPLTDNNNRYKKIIKSVIPKYIWESLKDYNILRFDQQATKILTEKIATFKPDIIYERAAYLQLSGVNTAKKHGIYHFLEVNSPYPEEQINLVGSSSWYHQKSHEAEKQQALLTNKVVVVSSALKKYYIDKHNIIENKFLVTPNAIDINKISIDETLVQTLFQKYQLENQFVIGFVGSIFRWHGVDLLIDAFAKIQDLNPNTRLMIVGDGEILPDLKAQANRLKLQEKIVFTGKVPYKMVFPHIELMNIAISPNSQWYASPVKLFEYGALKKAIIAPDNLPIFDVMEADKDGLIISPSVENLYQSIKILLESPQKCAEIALSFHQKVLNNHQWAHNAKRITEVASIST